MLRRMLLVNCERNASTDHLFRFVHTIDIHVYQCNVDEVIDWDRVLIGDIVFQTKLYIYLHVHVYTIVRTSEQNNLLCISVMHVRILEDEKLLETFITLEIQWNWLLALLTREITPIQHVEHSLCIPSMSLPCRGASYQKPSTTNINTRYQAVHRRCQNYEIPPILIA